jgi:hypothetical protein
MNKSISYWLKEQRMIRNIDKTSAKNIDILENLKIR